MQTGDNRQQCLFSFCDLCNLSSFCPPLETFVQLSVDHCYAPVSKVPVVCWLMHGCAIGCKCHVYQHFLVRCYQRISVTEWCQKWDIINIHKYDLNYLAPHVPVSSQPQQSRFFSLDLPVNDPPSHSTTQST